MTTTLTVRDETTTGTLTGTVTLELPAETMTVRELIRERVYQEVGDYNAVLGSHFYGLVQPTDAEVTLNGYEMKKPRMIDWKPQFERACDAFAAHGFVVLVDDRQVDDLDESITVSSDTDVTFLKLVPLVGG